ncbi:MAG: putative FAD-linked sulfhydryl oxidase [Faunusvirus sp.]|jgi:hypothetical protein|uniref:Sulfhydryl oxidase n=1 Tax=Faunusvirus sp. TaxID=2487766 RepID=A0A3G4ZXA0_9VIRU|nr:MAG: putative FAD-linked sulfhydryl oxidase [Faunusvirus sp.]
MSFGFSPDIWGPHAWFFIDTVCMRYPDSPTADDKKNYYNFLSLLEYILPCDKCRKNYKHHLSINPLSDDVLLTRQNLILWIINMHNLVRMKNNKPVYTYNSFINYYNKQYTKSFNFDILMAFIGVAIVGVLCYKFLYKK